MITSLSKWYLKGYRDPHKGLRVLGRISSSIDGFAVLRVPMHIPAQLSGLSRVVPLSGLFKVFGHFHLVARVIRRRRDVLLVREFLTLPLLLVFPLLFVSRARLRFLCQHNIARACTHKMHRRALAFMESIGFRFVVYESELDWEDAIAALSKPGSVKSIPLPFPTYQQGTLAVRSKRDRRLRVGFVGAIRGEKSPEWALTSIYSWLSEDANRPDWQLILGTSNEQALERWSGRAELYQTDSYRSYCEALAACDVLLLPYDETAYLYRTSGVLAEAVSAGCAVVIPDIPALSRQMSCPAVVGAAYAKPSEIVSAVQRAAALVGSEEMESALHAHRNVRGPGGVEAAMRRLLR